MRAAYRTARPTAVTHLLELKPGALTQSMLCQSPGFWALSFYLMIEYVRPQSVWTVLDVLPWGQAALGVTLVLLLFEARPQTRWQPLDTALVVFTTILLASIATAQYPSAGVDGLTTYLNWLILYVLITQIVTTPARFYLFFLMFLLWSLKMSQFATRSFVLNGFAFRDWGSGGGPGWFRNSGEMAIQMCIFLGLSLHWILATRAHWPRWKAALLLALLPGTALFALLASSSRGGQLGGVSVLLLTLAQSRHRWRGLVWVAALLPLLWVITPPEQKARFEAMGDDGTSVSRLIYWRDGIQIMTRYPILGIGYDNWMPFYMQYDPPGNAERPVRRQLPHNIFIEAGAELGFPGLLAFIALIALTFKTNARTRRLASASPDWGGPLKGFARGLDAALIGYLVSGFFVTVLYYPYFWMSLSMTAALHLIAWRAAEHPGTVTPQGVPILISKRGRRRLKPSVRA
jgi:putative inorganic carbon (HCO3(-)) transporter